MSEGKKQCFATLKSSGSALCVLSQTAVTSAEIRLFLASFSRAALQESFFVIVISVWASSCPGKKD